jgi:hypothetical protein
VGYGVAAAIKGEDSDEHYGGSSTSYSQDFHAYEGQPIIGTPAESSNKANGKHEGPSVLARFKETSAYERLSKEVGELGDHLIDELSTTARQVVLPALLMKLKNLIGIDLLEKKRPSTGTSEAERSAYGGLSQGTR